MSSLWEKYRVCDEGLFETRLFTRLDAVCFQCKADWLGMVYIIIRTCDIALYGAWSSLILSKRHYKCELYATFVLGNGILPLKMIGTEYFFITLGISNF